MKIEFFVPLAIQLGECISTYTHMHIKCDSGGLFIYVFQHLQIVISTTIRDVFMGSNLDTFYSRAMLPRRICTQYAHHVFLSTNIILTIDVPCDREQPGLSRSLQHVYIALMYCRFE